MRRNNLTLALAAVLCVATAVIGFGGEYIKTLFGAHAPASALVNTAAAAEPPTKAAPAPEPKRQEVTVYVTRTGERYHRGSCQHLHSSKIPMTLTEAKRQGYTPCQVCRPAR